MSRPALKLPAPARTYLAENPRRHAERVLVLFHGWLQRRQLELRAVTGAEVKAFLAAPAGRPVTTLTANSYRFEVRAYLRWAETRGLAGPFAAEELEGYHRKALPEEVRRFLQYLAPTREASTVKRYRGILRAWHEWLGQEGLTLIQVDRPVCLRWAHKLHAQGLHPGTRTGMLVCVRRYLDWLWEVGEAEIPGRELLLGADMPKLPEYLPRPLPPDADEVLQEKLKSERSTVALGLYVMRRTGLRVGELRRLERDCVREDHTGTRYLKVPLGKLHNERLVPLDDAALAALGELQARGRAESPWLIEGGRREHPVSLHTYQATLTRVGGDLPLAEPLTTHRLRHTFATSLMNGGMSLMGIKKLLGHRDQRMTLRYTQIADETVGREYFEALSRVADRYELVRTEGNATAAEPDPRELLQDAIRWVTRNLCAGPSERRARLLVRRLEAARDELEELLAGAPELR